MQDEKEPPYSREPVSPTHGYSDSDRDFVIIELYQEDGVEECRIPSQNRSKQDEIQSEGTNDPATIQQEDHRSPDKHIPGDMKEEKM